MKHRRRRAKVVKLDDRIWVKSGESIKTYREQKLKEQDGKCAVTGVKLKDDAVLDHSHAEASSGYWSDDGRIRGVIASPVNMLEGRFLKLFKRAKIEEKYNIGFEDFLIKLGEYLKQDNTQEKFHYMYMNDFRKVVKRWGKVKLLKRLEEDFNIKPSNDTTVTELVQLYVQQWVYEIEKSY